MKDYVVSVIVPVYNVRNYLKECVESIINQTYHKLDIILVDDGSTDGSSTVCDAFAAKDNRIRVFHKENGGLSDARNFGMQHINGDFFLFVDSDDLIELNMIEYLIATQEKTSCDVISCKYDFLINNKLEETHICTAGKIDIEVFLLMLFKGEILHSACGKLFSKEISKELVFPLGKYYEDEYTIYDIILNHSNAISNKASYVYRMREGSITHSKNMQKQSEDLLGALEHIELVINRDYPSYRYALDYKILQDSLELIKNEILMGQKSYISEKCLEKVRNVNYKNLKLSGIGNSYKIQYFMVKNCFSLYRFIFVLKKTCQIALNKAFPSST